MLAPADQLAVSVEGEVGCSGGAVVPLKYLMCLVKERPATQGALTFTLAVARDNVSRERP